MKIVHICPTMTDGLSYQENYLTKYHRRLGLDVTVITSCWIYNENGQLIKTENTTYMNNDGVKVIRLLIKNDKPYTYKFKTFVNLTSTLQRENPDILFIHGVQWVYIKEIVKFLKNKKITVYVDNHADYSNSASNWVSKYILHKMIWRYFAQLIIPFTTRFYGVLPARVKILTELYGIQKNKCELLVMGADDDLVRYCKNNAIKERIRRQYGIQKDEFLIVTGGKVDSSKKQVLLLMKAINQLNRSKVKLLIFGSVTQELRNEFDSLCNQHILYAGWVHSAETYEYIAAADLVIYPGRHSVLWEQTVAQEKPMIIKYWEGTTHVDIGDNVAFLYEDSINEISRTLLGIINTKKYQKMLQAAQSDKKNKFLYSNIAKQSIRDML